MANSSTKPELKIDLSSILGNVRFELFKEINNIQRDAEAVGLDVSTYENMLQKFKNYW